MFLMFFSASFSFTIWFWDTLSMWLTLGWQDAERWTWADWRDEIWPWIYLSVFYEHNKRLFELL